MSIPTLALSGNQSNQIDVECRITNGLPSLVIVGFANRAVIESRERLRSAFSSSKLNLPPRRITVNLAPADLPKDSPAYDLAIAVAIMEAQQLIKPPPKRAMFFGELGLGGDIKSIRGVIGLLLSAREKGYKIFYLPLSNLRQSLLVPGITIKAAANLTEVYLDLSGMKEIVSSLSSDGLQPSSINPASHSYPNDFSQVIGQNNAKRALEIAAVGNHNLLLIGAPGTGKSMLAKALPSILPPLSPEEILQISHLHSLTSRNYDNLITARPFRSPHHSISTTALLGGGSQPRPGEVTLAHRGVLFLDELPEFHHDALEGLRQPLEDHSITITRNRDNLTFPANFILVATANPCPCGHFGTSKKCICPAFEVIKYQQRISGPLLDRIDLYVEAEDIIHERLLDDGHEETSVLILKRVSRARYFQKYRQQNVDNSLLTNQEIKKFARLSTQGKNLLNQSAKQLRLSARSYMRVLKVARSIADLDEDLSVKPKHIGEALQFRKRENPS